MIPKLLSGPGQDSIFRHHDITPKPTQASTSFNISRSTTMAEGSYSQTLLAVLSDNADKHPSNVYIRDGPTSSITYGTARILATQLIPQRLPPDILHKPHVRIAILSRNNALVPLLYWTAWYFGAVVVPFSATTDPSLWPHMAAVVNAEVIVVSRELQVQLVTAMASEISKDRHPRILLLDSLIPSEHLDLEDRDAVVPKPHGLITACNRWAAQTNTANDAIVGYPVRPDTQMITLFTSSAVDASTLKCVTYTHAMTMDSGRRTLVALGGSKYSSAPKMHFGWLPLSHCFELMISLW